MKIGILFGGPSREREISFAGGRTVYDNLDKSLFEPVPIFIDSLKNFILLDWQYIYKGTIRDFYPPISFVPKNKGSFQIYIESLGNLSPEDLDILINSIGKTVKPDELKDHIDFAFLALHGYFGEDGTIQGLLESMEIPYSGSGIISSAIGMNKAVQKQMMKSSGWETPEFSVIQRKAWLNRTNTAKYHQETVSQIGLPYVVRPANQGSSIGVGIIHDESEEAFSKAVNAGFFIREIEGDKWNSFGKDEKTRKISEWTDIREGVGLPAFIGSHKIYHPRELGNYLDNHNWESKNPVKLIAEHNEPEVIVEAFIDGKEFSCIVVLNEADSGKRSIALPPTEIIKGKEVFDYRSKYLPGLSRKVTPINIPGEQINQIREACERLYDSMGFNVYARIDGFITKDGEIFLNDPNTTSGMLPSSFFFHQAAEIGLNPSQFLTYIVRTSISERIRTGFAVHSFEKLLDRLDLAIDELHIKETKKTHIGIIMGGYSTERHISVESGRNIYEKLASSEKYEPIPIFLTGDENQYDLYQIPVNLLLKDNADDIKDKIMHFNQHPVIHEIRQEAKEITGKYAYSNYRFQPLKISIEELDRICEGVFIALHGRPGEDGSLQLDLEKYNIPYNGSGPTSSKITINKYETNRILSDHGFQLAKQAMVYQTNWDSAPDSVINNLEEEFKYPLIAKPVDDGCSSAVKMIKTREELQAYFEAIFRNKEFVDPKINGILGLKPKEEFPVKESALIEELIVKGDSDHFLEITGGMLIKEDGEETEIEIFEPSETLATGNILSLEEKFLAGEGQNITPARLAGAELGYNEIAQKVKSDLKKVVDILGISGYCRIDAFVRVYSSGKIETIIIEVNSLPGMTPATCIFHQAAINGYKPFDFIDRIIEFGFEKNKAKIYTG